MRRERERESEKGDLGYNPINKNKKFLVSERGWGWPKESSKERKKVQKIEREVTERLKIPEIRKRKLKRN